MCKITNYPKEINSIKLTPVLPTELPPRNAIILKFINNTIKLEDIQVQTPQQYREHKGEKALTSSNAGIHQSQVQYKEFYRNNQHDYNVWPKLSSNLSLPSTTINAIPIWNFELKQIQEELYNLKHQNELGIKRWKMKHEPQIQKIPQGWELINLQFKTQAEAIVDIYTTLSESLPPAIQSIQTINHAMKESNKFETGENERQRKELIYATINETISLLNNRLYLLANHQQKLKTLMDKQRFIVESAHIADLDILLTTYTLQILILTGVGSKIKQLPKISDYYWISQEGTNAFGGVAILFHKTLKTKLITQKRDFLLVELDILSKPILLGAVYILPGKSIPQDIFDTYVDKSFYIFGDYNAKHTDWFCTNNNASGVQLRNWLDNTGREMIYPNQPTSKRSTEEKIEKRNSFKSQGNNIWKYRHSTFHPYAPSFEGLTANNGIIRDHQVIADTLANYYEKHFETPAIDPNNISHIDAMKEYDVFTE
ncbi:unnamed protein product [Rotaria magnacalcarata]|uniref:Endonuclease/exonuclease/phosphatase domain-containing protein n=2 Tax=Rotaria magnacalcarata TaxID=392030 RepID=A0A816ZAV0_9BILA|nr:unnamed protein product [Rotaria magnacalcarata]